MECALARMTESEYVCTQCYEMLLSGLNCDVFKPFRSHRRLLAWYFGCVLEDYHTF